MNHDLQMAVKQAQVMNGRRPTITVNAPNQWATNCFVLNSILESRTALQMAVISEDAVNYPAGSQSDTIRKQMIEASVWKDVEMLAELLRPFSDAIHQLEGDKLHIAECHEVLILLRKHVVD